MELKFVLEVQEEGMGVEEEFVPLMKLVKSI